MTTTEAALALNITRGQVHHLIKDGRLKAEKRGRDWWITPEALELCKAIPRTMGWKKGKPRK